MGILLVAGGGVSLILPETLHEHLPQTLEDAEKIKTKEDFGLGKYLFKQF